MSDTSGAILVEISGPDDHLGATGSWVFVVGVSVALLTQLALLLWRTYRCRRSARLEKEEYHEGALPAVGETVLHGTVEHAADAEVAVRVEVTQEGTEDADSGGWSHRWTEVGRKVLVAPFYLRLDGGARIRVEPSENVQLVDALDGKILVDRTKRIRTAELIPDEHIYARGELVRAHDPERPEHYRGGQALLLQPPRGRPMLLSSESLGERFLAEARMHRGFAIACVVALALLHLSLSSFYQRASGGEVTDGMITRRWIDESTDSEGDTHYTYRVEIMTEAPFVFIEDLDETDYLIVNVGYRVPVHAVPHRASTAQIGRHAAIFFLHALLATLGWLALLVAYAGIRRKQRPWYQQRKVVDRGDGRLPDVTAD